ncbi:hypothetical protein ACGFYQ_30655 [Streptomyces sp. NPDC048258]|uniref:hypothetical protein n=1 Tax=Streptomyces sp. NPDC048258 TaxID=3365527 RepID=UPI0037188734
MASGTDTFGDGRTAGHEQGHGAGHALVRDLVRSAVTELAPEELPLLAGLQRFDDATVVRRLSGRGRRREPLGFGAGEVAVLVTPVVWLVLDQIGQRMVNAALDRAGARVTSGLRRLLRRPAAPVTVPPLTREQLAEVRALVCASAVQRGLSAGRAEVIADAVVTRLTLADAPGGESTEPSPTPAAPEPPGAPGTPAPAPGAAPAGGQG